MSRWKFVNHDGTRFYDIAVNPDGSLHNPNGYPEDAVRAAIAFAEEHRHQRRSKAATKAAETRRKRQELQVYKVAQKINLGHRYGPASHCVICKKGLGDQQSIERGIGSDCWQKVLGHLELVNTP